MRVKNPILTGFNADPCICRKGEDYYIAVSSFEWFPGIPVYHSRDMKRWELYTHVLTDPTTCNLTGMPSAAGIWAPCLTYCQEEDLFYVVYGIMNSMNARYFDIDNYVITASDIRGPWSEPVYLHSSGFDASMFHDDDGRKWVVSLDWETRDGYSKPGEICLVEYDPKKKTILGLPRRIWAGGTNRGCLEAPHLTKHDGRYYLMCAEGGTGYYHCVTMARADSVWGPYEGDPTNPILTSVPDNYQERADIDHLKARYFNSSVYLQKAGHGSYVETTLGETYMVYHCGRPFIPELRCTLGRETCMQKMRWTEDGWLRSENEDNIATTYTEGSKLEDWHPEPLMDHDNFDCKTLGIQYYTPRIDAKTFTDLESQPGCLRIRGQEAISSQNKVSMIARKLTSVNADVITRMDFTPEIYQHSAGLVLYYDNMNYAYLCKYYSETLRSPALSLVRVRNGNKTDFRDARRGLNEGPIWLKLEIRGRESQFFWSDNAEEWTKIGPAFDTSTFSDEYSQYGEFTGTFVGLACEDRAMHRKTAAFDCFIYEDREPDLLRKQRIDQKEDITKIRKKYRDIRFELGETDTHHNPYSQEKREQECIRKGDLDGLYKAISEDKEGSIGTLARDPVRQERYLTIVLITLASRSAVEGGLRSELAYSMADSFTQRADRLQDVQALRQLGRHAEIEFCMAVSESKERYSDNPLVNRCQDLIEKQINRRIKVGDLAQALHVSPDYLSHLFRNEKGMPLSDYIAREKVMAASHRLIFSDDTYAEIAAAFSFSSQSHFGQVFNKWMGMTPKRYREMYGEEYRK